MTRLLLILPAAALLAACNVSRDDANDSTTFSVDRNQVDRAADEAAGALKGAANEVQDAARTAAPKLEEAARDVGNAAARAGDRIENGADRAADRVRAETRDNPPPANAQ